MKQLDSDSHNPPRTLVTVRVVLQNQNLWSPSQRGGSIVVLVQLNIDLASTIYGFTAHSPLNEREEWRDDSD